MMKKLLNLIVLAVAVTFLFGGCDLFKRGGRRQIGSLPSVTGCGPGEELVEGICLPECLAGEERFGGDLKCYSACTPPKELGIINSSTGEVGCVEPAIDLCDTVTCPDGFYCDTSIGNCKPQKIYGRICSDCEKECISGQGLEGVCGCTLNIHCQHLYATSVCNSSTYLCVAPTGGPPCTEDGDCGAGTYCDSALSNNSGQCLYEKDYGAKCKRGTECKNPQWCYDPENDFGVHDPVLVGDNRGTCVASNFKAPPGGKCLDDANCACIIYDENYENYGYGDNPNCGVCPNNRCGKQENELCETQLLPKFDYYNISTHIGSLILFLLEECQPGFYCHYYAMQTNVTLPGYSTSTVRKFTGSCQYLQVSVPQTSVNCYITTDSTDSSSYKPSVLNIDCNRICRNEHEWWPGGDDLLYPFYCCKCKE